MCYSNNYYNYFVFTEQFNTLSGHKGRVFSMVGCSPDCQTHYSTHSIRVCPCPGRKPEYPLTPEYSPYGSVDIGSFRRDLMMIFVERDFRFFLPKCLICVVGRQREPGGAAGQTSRNHENASIRNLLARAAKRAANDSWALPKLL